MSFFKKLELGKHEAQLLFSIEYMATEMDVSLSSDDEFKMEKENWLISWEKVIEKQGFDLSIKDSKKEIIQELKELDQIKQQLILFEAYLFKPYFNLNLKSTSGFGKGKQKEKSFTRESYSRMENIIKDISEKSLGNSDYLEKAKEVYEKTLDELPNDKIFSLKKKTFFTIAAAAAVAITGGLAAPAIGTIIGGLMGLSGAAATSAGLALLGGGAIAAGGGGIAAGTAVIIGGGALVGGAAGGYIGNSLNENNTLVLSQLSKLITNIKVFIPKDEKEDAISSCLKKLKELRKSLSDEVQTITDEKKKQNKEKSLKYYNEAIKNLQNYEEELLGL